MTVALLLALAAAFLTGFGGRDQRIVARLRHNLGASTGLLATAVASVALSAAFMAWAGAGLARVVPETAKSLLVAIALLLAAVELLWTDRVKRPREPTRSLGAIALVLVARQVADAPRLLLFAIAAVTGSPLPVALGGALGGAGAVAAGWAMGGALDRIPLRTARIALGAVMLIAAIIIGASARELVG